MVVKKTCIKMLLYSGMIVYLLVDLTWWQGPLHGYIKKQKALPQEQHDYAIVAQVLGYPISLYDIDIAVWHTMQQYNIKPRQITANYLSNLRRQKIDILIDLACINQKIKVQRKKYVLTDADKKIVTARWQAFVTQFSNQQQAEQFLEQYFVNGSSDYRKRLVNQLQQEKYLHYYLQEAVAVTEQEVASFIQYQEEKLPQKASYIQCQLQWQPAQNQQLKSGNYNRNSYSSQKIWIYQNNFPDWLQQRMTSKKISDFPVTISKKYAQGTLQVTLYQKQDKKWQATEWLALIRAQLKFEKMQQALAIYRSELRRQHRSKIKVNYQLLDKAAFTLKSLPVSKEQVK